MSNPSVIAIRVLDRNRFYLGRMLTGVRSEDSQNLVDALNDALCESIPQFVKGEVSK